MIRKILKYGDPVLETPCDPLEEFDTEELKQLVDDMFETMYDASGVGLAAPQIGVLKRLTVIDCSCGEDPGERLVLINPEILAAEGKQVGEEGCLSIPGFREDVKRAQKVTVRARDAKGKTFEIEGEDLLARAIQHENDHLDGVLMIDRMGLLKKRIVHRKMLKRSSEG
jgi:peptide deformylase